MECKKCKASLQATDIICPNCGEPVEKSNIETTALNNESKNEEKKSAGKSKGKSLRALKKSLPKTFEEESPEKKALKQKEVKKNLIKVGVIVLCVLLLSAISLVYSRGVVYLFASSDDGSIAMTTLSTTPLAGKVVAVRSNYIGIPIKQVNPDAFRGSSVQNVIIPEEITLIGFNSFYDATSLKDIALHGNITIQQDAFHGCTSLTGVTIGEGECTILANAFAGCTALQNVSVPNGLKSISRYSFDGCDALVYSVYDNGLYLGNAENPYVVLIKANAADITSLEIHPDTKLVASNALADSLKLTSISYRGTAEEWNAIKFGADWNKNTGKYKIHCSDETLEK